MTPREPVVSVVLPAYNAEAFIEDAIESLFPQTFEDWELLCVDDASSDNTAKLIAEAAKHDDRVRLVSLDGERGTRYGTQRGSGTRKR